MDPFAAFALTVGSIIAISNHAVLMEHYAARDRHAPTVLVQPAWEPAPSSPARALATRDFIQHWQGFMQPSGGRCVCPPPRN